jgi:hypothetical protein
MTNAHGRQSTCQQLPNYHRRLFGIRYQTCDRAFQHLGFDVLRRKEYVRDLLVLPSTHPDHQDHRLHTNAQVAQDADFWATVFHILDRLQQDVHTQSPLDALESSPALSFNFGTWETKSSKDENSLECHAQLHIRLKPGYMERLDSIYPDCKLRYCRGDAVDYVLRDCDVLYDTCIRPAYRELDLLPNDFDAYSSRLASVEAKVDSLCKEVTTRFDNIEASLKELLSKTSTRPVNRKRSADPVPLEEQPSHVVHPRLDDVSVLGM